MKRQYVTSYDLVEIGVDLQKSDIFYIAGTSSIYCPAHNTKYIDRSICRQWPDEQGEIVLLTPGEVARVELNRAFRKHNRKHSFARKSTMPLLDIGPPMFFERPKKGLGVYVDLIGAYHQIYRWLSLDTCWPRGDGSIDWSLWDVAEYLENWKAARNAVVGVTRSTQITTIKGTVRKSKRFRNPYLAPMFWRQLMDILHDVAYKARHYRASYIATDGYIFLSYRQATKFLDWLDQFGLEYRLIEGDVNLKGWGAYSVKSRWNDDHKVTDLFKSTRPGSHRVINNIQPDTPNYQSVRFWYYWRLRKEVERE